MPCDGANAMKSQHLRAGLVHTLALVAASAATAGVSAKPAPVVGTDLGVIGPTYEISEPSLLTFIEQRLRQKERTGELKRLQEQAVARGAEAVKNPKPAPWLRAADSARTFYFDPTYTLDHNITDGQGRLLFAAGTRANPLDIVSMSRHLLFIDARDRRQLSRARELIGTYQGRIKLILTGGSYLDLMKSWHRPVYYDQEGRLTQRLGIKQVPALVSQEGRRLRIDELELRP